MSFLDVDEDLGSEDNDPPTEPEIGVAISTSALETKGAFQVEVIIVEAATVHKA